jgi:hypothetical protein
MIPAGPLFHKPKSVIAARNILYATLFLSLVSYILLHFVLQPSGHLNIRAAISSGVLLILLYIAIHSIGFGKKWALYLFVVLFIINIGASWIYAPFLFRTSPVLGFLFVLEMLLQILALVYLFSKASTEWFNSFHKPQ